MPLFKLSNQQIILVIGSNGYRSKTGKRPLATIISFVAGMALTWLLLGAYNSKRLPSSKPPKSSRRRP